ncbi:MAG: alkaline phosphatase family protein, partial [Chitinophagales bacterium]
MAIGFPGHDKGGARADRLALLVTFDGLRPDALQRPETPNFHRLLCGSAYTLSAVVDFPWTLPSHVSMVTGLCHERHGVSWDFYDPSRGPVLLPTVFTLTARHGIRTALVSGKQKFAHLNRPGTIGTVLIDEETRLDNAAQVEHELLLLARAVDLLRGSAYGLALLHVALLDWFGHVHEWMSPQYLKAVGVADLILGRILELAEALRAAGRPVLLIVSADHGGHGRVHDDPR